MVYSSNSYLNREQMTVNATYLMGEFINHGWSKNAIAGMLGNMERESTINPGVWQNLNEGNMSGGYGLVQWTPASNYITWASNNNYPIGDINGQIARIIYELENNLQYIPTNQYPMSFREFTVSTESPEYLASVFLHNYERAGVGAEEERRQNARYWYDNLDGEGGGGGRPVFPTTIGTPITSEYGWRIHPLPPHDLRFHDGTDFATNTPDTPIYATQTGIVIENSFNEIAGWYIRIKHVGDYYYSGYQHLAVQSPISVGANVTKGQRIGTMGMSGSTTGVHLHFQIATHENGWYTEEGTIDPEIYLEMDFGDGDSESNMEKDLITLWLVDALNGWKY